MTDHEPRRPRRRDDAPSFLRIGLTLLGVLLFVALAGWGVFAFAEKLVGPAQSPVVETPVAVVPPSETTEPTESATPTVTAAPVVTPAPAPVVTPAPAPAPAAAPAKSPAPTTTGKYVVVIDAGHQGKGDNTAEPIGPGASTTKPAVADGAAGYVTRRRESLNNLEVALRVRDQLQARGVKVVMVRTSENVNIANSERAKIANDANADLLLRIHCDSVDNHSLRGFLTLVPGKNQWTGPIVASSAKAGKAIHKATLATTGAKDRGITPRTDMSGFNWATVPAVIVEMGMMSNAEDDRLLASDAYQAKLAEGMANGVMAYLNSK